ncbi:MAG: competence/damage-inducible protein A [Pseudomonadales bacterium]|nr:competence/damage-inducible protein A [Pseudomonadales bacterium]
MAGIPSVMRAMISTIQLEGGAVVQSRSVTAYLGESQVATGLEAIQDRYAEIDIGSYPFMDDDGYGTTLVIRGTDPVALDKVLDEIKQLIVDAGETPRNVVAE